MWDFYGKIWGTLGKCGKHLGKVVGTSGENLGEKCGIFMYFDRENVGFTGENLGKNSMESVLPVNDGKIGA